MSMIEVMDRDSVRWITFNRPEKLNTFRDEDLRAVIDALSVAKDDFGAVVFRGAKGNFSAGSYVDQFSGFDSKTSMKHVRLVADFLEAIRRVQVPTVASIEGYCLGLGFDVAAVSDLRVAGSSAMLGMPEINVGIPSIMDASLLQQHVGLSRAKEMLLSGEMYTASKLAEWGFINYLTTDGAVDDRADQLANSMADKSPVAMAAQKRLFENWLQLPHREGVDASLMEYALTYADPRTEDWIRKYRETMKARKAGKSTDGGTNDG